MESENKTQNISSYVLTVFAVSAAFGLGIFVSKLSDIQQLTVGNTSYSGTLSAQSLDQQYINAVLQAVSSDYLGDIPDSKVLTYGALEGIIETFDDRYTSFLSPEAAKSYFETASNEFEGVGITLAREDSYIKVETVLEGFPAQAAGILSGDLILSVDGESMSGLSPQEVATAIRGEAGTKVKLEIYRSKSNETMAFDVTREKIDLDNMDWELLDNGVAKINIYRFTESSVEDFIANWDKVASEVAKSGAEKVIVDLRNNPGGYVSAVRYVAEEFLADGNIVYQEESKNGRVLQTVDQRKGKLENVKLVVLVNEGSASSSEIFASAIQDNSRGTVIGQPTVGKGVEQKLVEMRDGSLLILVYRRWLTPKGMNISTENPIKPDELVENIDKDSQLESAIKKLN